MSGRGWRVRVTDADLTFATDTSSGTVHRADGGGLDLRRRWLRWFLIDDGQALVQLRGLSRSGAAELHRSVMRFALGPAIDDAVTWHKAVTRMLSDAERSQRWISVETVTALLDARPAVGLLERVRTAGVHTLMGEETLEAVGYLDADLGAVVAERNEHIVDLELATRQGFFDTIEKSPLTTEQARAVICLDNRVQVLAAAGSGKTSVMVARAAYAVSRGFVPPGQILLLAFNKAAATELQQRVDERFAAAGIESSGVRAATFHSFGLDVIGRATGRKPRLAGWIDQGRDIETIEAIVDELRDASETFRYNWDLYRLLFANTPVTLEEHEPDGYDKATKRTGYQTMNGEVVNSHGERLIADFLFLNGVRYEYEKPYTVELADATHSQYRPDFYYPDIDTWHEHWAVDRDGRVPDAFDGYAQGMEWKRQVHSQYGTALIETTWAEVVLDEGLSKLKDELQRRGLVLDWNPDRPPKSRWDRPMKHEDLARLIRTFMAHVKSNGWDIEGFDRRLGSDAANLAGYRTRLFLDIYWPIHAAWQRRLDADGSIDFEDMLGRAADHLEAGDVDCGYEMVLVDEFQDASRARARLVRGLVRTPGRYLLAVGDDWQAINRFAGADLSVMTDFAILFGPGPQLSLTTTFRCPQAICDVASRFVTKNPTQFRKPMRSSQTGRAGPVTVIRSDDPASALSAYLAELSAEVAEGNVTAGPSGIVSVDVLGRYGFERRVVPARGPSNLRVAFRTIHSAKGLEADYVVVPGMTMGAHGFPSNVADDPVLELAMPSPESFRYAEERRLLFVALTRARRAVTLITPPHGMSPFVVELLKDPDVVMVGADDSTVDACPACDQGALVMRQGPYGPFLGCSAFPRCTFTRSVKLARSSEALSHPPGDLL